MEPVFLALVQRRTAFAKQLVRVLARPPTLTSLGELPERPAAHLVDRIGIEQDECAYTLRVRGGEQRRHSAALIRSQHGRSRSAGRLQHGPQILHPRLERGELGAVVGQPGTALVEQNQPKGTGEPLVKVPPLRPHPPVDEIRAVGGYEDEIDLPLPNDLIRDRDAPASHVSDLVIHTKHLHIKRRTRKEGRAGRASGDISEHWPNRVSPRLTLHESVGNSPVARPFPIRSQAPRLLEV
jgi:hypothetical protein